MRKYMLAAIFSFIFAIAIALPHRIEAMTFSAPARALNGAATIDVEQLEQVRWRYHSRHRFHYYSYYASWLPYYPDWEWRWWWW